MRSIYDAKNPRDIPSRKEILDEFQEADIPVGPIDQAAVMFSLLADREGKTERGLKIHSENGKQYIAVPPLNAGNYRIIRKAAAGSGSAVAEEWCHLCVTPYKITAEQLHTMLEEIQSSLPLRIADSIVRLQTKGAAPVPLSGMALWQEKRNAKDTSKMPSMTPAAGEAAPASLANTWRQELAFLKNMLKGTEDRKTPGFLKILESLRESYLRNLHPQSVPVPAYQLRHPDPASLKKACRPGNLFRGADDTLIFKKFDDRRVDLHPDIHENRVIRVVHDMLAARLACLLHNIEAQPEPGGAGADDLQALAEQARGLRRDLARARAAAAFLDQVGRLKILPPKVTVALMKIAPYTAALDILRALRQRPLFSLYKEDLEYFLDNTPALYQKWCSLLVMDSVLQTLIKLKDDSSDTVEKNTFIVEYMEHCFKNNGNMLYMDFLYEDNRIFKIKILYKKIVSEISLTLEKNFIGIDKFYAHGNIKSKEDEYKSLSFNKRPDICLKLKTWREGSSERPQIQLLIFDPKYKKYSLKSRNKGKDGQKTDNPREDIDKMHTYRDSIVRMDDAKRLHHCVDFAAVLHPCDSLGRGGVEDVEYFTFDSPGSVSTRDRPGLPRGVGAVRCVPQGGESSRKGIDEIVSAFLAAGLGAE